MSTGYRIKDQEAAYFLTFRVVYWIDVFTRKNFRDILIDSLNYCQTNKGLEVFAFVIMSNHMHMLVRSATGNLSTTIRDFKKYTSKKIIDFLIDGNESRSDWMLRMFKYAASRRKNQSTYQVWTNDNHAEEIFSNIFIAEKVNYIHNNPVKAGIVQFPEEYIYSSAKYYAGEDCVLNVIPVSLRWKTY